MTDSYHYNLPGPVVWIVHILIGALLAYYGYASLKNTRLPDYVYIGIMFIGVLAILYHTHIWLTDKDDKKDDKATTQ
jgi:hypothetical protein